MEQYFNPRPPRGGRRLCVLAFQLGFGISIHALREEGDAPPVDSSQDGIYFNPRPPRGGRPKRSVFQQITISFQSTPSARRATRHCRRLQNHRRISIHALREEGDIVEALNKKTFDISIHALREEGDLKPPKMPRPNDGFQSTPSARRATFQGFNLDDTIKDISIHALREEGDSKSGEKIHHVCSIIHTCAQFEKELYEGSGEMQNKSC